MKRETVILLCSLLAFILLAGLFGALGFAPLCVASVACATVLGLTILFVRWP